MLLASFRLRLWSENINWAFANEGRNLKYLRVIRK